MLTRTVWVSAVAVVWCIASGAVVFQNHSTYRAINGANVPYEPAEELPPGM